MVNTYALRQQFEWALEKTVCDTSLWYGYNAEEFGYDENIRQTTEKILLDTDIFILTLGLSEVWYDEPTGGVFWKAVPQKHYDSTRHKFRVTTVEENKSNLKRIYRTFRIKFSKTHN